VSRDINQPEQFMKGLGMSCTRVGSNARIVAKTVAFAAPGSLLTRAADERAEGSHHGGHPNNQQMLGHGSPSIGWNARAFSPVYKLDICQNQRKKI
jgi:hypothetical protein